MKTKRASKQQKIADRFNVPLESIKFERGTGWMYITDKRLVILGKSFHDVQCTADWALKKIT